jgi:hypothetical protein
MSQQIVAVTRAAYRHTVTVAAATQDIWHLGLAASSGDHRLAADGVVCYEVLNVRESLSDDVALRRIGN